MPTAYEPPLPLPLRLMAH